MFTGLQHRIYTHTHRQTDRHLERFFLETGKKPLRQVEEDSLRILGGARNRRGNLRNVKGVGEETRKKN